MQGRGPICVNAPGLLSQGDPVWSGTLCFGNYEFGCPYWLFNFGRQFHQKVLYPFWRIKLKGWLRQKQTLLIYLTNYFNTNTISFIVKSIKIWIE